MSESEEQPREARKITPERPSLDYLRRLAAQALHDGPISELAKAVTWDLLTKELPSQHPPSVALYKEQIMPKVLIALEQLRTIEAALWQQPGSEIQVDKTDVGKDKIALPHLREDPNNENTTTT